jgi:iron complex outermembrane receptor protein
MSEEYRSTPTIYGPVFMTENAGQATIQGLELELAAQLTEGLELDFAYGYTDATYDDFRDANFAGDDFSGNTLPEAAKHTVTTALNFRRSVGTSLELTARADLVYRSSAFFEPDNVPQYEQGDYTMLGARLGIASADGRWGVTGWGRNLTDEEYVVYRGDGVIVPGQAIQSLGLPRTYGVEISFGF